MKTLILTILLSTPAMAFDTQEMRSVIETSCEINLFSRLRLQDRYRHVFPPKWNNKVFVKREVNKCVKEMFDEFRD